MSVPKIQRKEEFLKLLYEKGHLEVRDIADRFGISGATVRRDLHRMAEEGLLELVYGGATLARKDNYSIRSRQTLNVEAKRAIGKLAAGFVRNGDTIFIDSGTTCDCMVPHLLSKRDLVVITNSNLVAAQLGESTSFSIIQLGGRFRFARMDSVGPHALMVMRNLSGYHAFVGTDGLTRDLALTSTDSETADLYRAVIENASETTLLVDHTKFGAPALHRFAEIGAVRRLVTDLPVAEEWAKVLERLGTEVVCPSENTS
jgi:DeoR family transcriptional regulator of aga operon